MFGSKKDKEKIKKAEKQEKIAAIGASLGSAGAGLGAIGRPGGEKWGELVAEQSGNIAAAAAEEKAAAQERIEKRAGSMGQIGRILGATVGTAIGGPMVGAALGGAVGGTAGYKAAGGSNPLLQQAGGYGIQSAIPGMLGKVMPGGVPGVAPGVGADQLAKAGTGSGGTQATQVADMAGRGIGYVDPARAAAQFPSAAGVAAPAPQGGLLSNLGRQFGSGAFAQNLLGQVSPMAMGFNGGGQYPDAGQGMWARRNPNGGFNYSFGW